jgi:CitMHS family citrate-Mg2+:H+ or citrate-Ca2+:H+ symporter
MTALIGLLTILVLLTVIITKKLSPLTALIAVPIIGALFAGFQLDIGKFIISGIKDIAPVVAMFAADL